MPSIIDPIEINIPTNTAGSSALMGIGDNLWNTTSANRGTINDIFSDFLGGNFDYTQSPVWGMYKNAAENQYGIANKEAMSSLPSGGALLDALAGNITGKANTLTNAAGQVGQGLWDQAYDYNMVTAPAMAADAYGTASQAQTALAQSAVQKAIEDAKMMASQRNTDVGAETAMAELAVQEMLGLEGLATSEQNAQTSANAAMYGSNSYANSAHTASQNALYGGLGSALGELASEWLLR